MNDDLKINIIPVQKEQWDDFVKLFGPRGACGGCWCMYWKLSHTEFENSKGDQNKLNQKDYICSGNIPGLIAYFNDEPIGWIAVEPRENFTRLANSRILKPVDDQKVWSIPCFFIDKRYRNKGISTKLIEAAAKYAAESGAKIIEGYPTDPGEKKMPAPFVYTGLANAFLKAGFIEVERRSLKRPIMRKFIS